MPFAFPLPSLFSTLVVAFYLALAVVLIRKYLRTRDVGFVWLGVAVVVWPLVSFLVRPAMGALFQRMIRGQIEIGQMTVGQAAYIVGSIQQLITLGLLLVAAILLSRTRPMPSVQAEA